MTELVHKAEGLSLEELEAHTGELLPAREQMQLVDLTFQVAPVVQAPVAVALFDSNAAAVAQSNVAQQNADASGTGIGIGIGGIGAGTGTGVGAGGIAENTAVQGNDATIIQTT